MRLSSRNTPTTARFCLPASVEFRLVVVQPPIDSTYFLDKFCRWIKPFGFG
ncbi:unnamed protein product [Meloidogyne enterolobii]|uniref:Uncharacterized protein n=1 Tax=Meloidogyne enterolobii TaxID=390850 RepID=A0ACB0Z4R3_MELEN